MPRLVVIRGDYKLPFSYYSLDNGTLKVFAKDSIYTQMILLREFTEMLTTHPADFVCELYIFVRANLPQV